MRYFLRCIIVMITLVPLSSIFALDPNKQISQNMHDILQKEDRLPQISVYAITQTADGYLWFATEEGLARFNGASFAVFNKQNTGVFKKSNYITAHFEDRKIILFSQFNHAIF